MTIKHTNVNEPLLDHYETHFYNHEHYSYYSYLEMIGHILISVKNVDSVYFVYVRSILGFKLISIDSNLVMHKSDETFILKTALDQYFISVFQNDWIIKPECKIKSTKKNIFSFLSAEEILKEPETFTNLESTKNKILENLRTSKDVFLSMHILSKAVAIPLQDKELCIIDNLINMDEYVVNISSKDLLHLKNLLGTEISKKTIYSINQIKTLHKAKEIKKVFVFNDDKNELRQRIKDFLVSELSYNSDVQRLLECIFFEIIEKNELKGKFFYLEGIINNLIHLRDFSFDLLTKLLEDTEFDVDILRKAEMTEYFIQKVDFYIGKKETERLLENILNVFFQEVNKLDSYKSFLIKSFDYSEKLFTEKEFLNLNLSTTNMLTWKTLFKKPHQKLCHYVLFMENFIKFLPNPSQNFVKCLKIIETLKDFLTEVNDKKSQICSIEETIKFKKQLKDGCIISCTNGKGYICSFDSKLKDKLSVAIFTDSIALLSPCEGNKLQIIFKTEYENVEVRCISDINFVIFYDNNEYKLEFTAMNLDIFLECFYVLKNLCFLLSGRCDNLFYKKIENKRIFYRIFDKNEYFNNRNDSSFVLFLNDLEENLKLNNSKSLFCEFGSNQCKLKRINYNSFEFIDEIILDDSSENFAKALIDEIHRYSITPPFQEQFHFNFKREIEKVPKQKEKIFKKYLKTSFNFFNLISYKKLDFLFDYAHFYLINVHNECNFASRDELSIVKLSNETTFFKSLSTFNDLEYTLNGMKISQKKMNQLIFYDDLFLPNRNTIKEIYGEFSQEEDINEMYLRKYRIEDLTSLVVYWFNQNIFTMFSLENISYIKHTCSMEKYLNFNDLYNMCFYSTRPFFKRYVTFIFELHKFIKHESINRLLNIFQEDSIQINSFIETLLKEYNRD